jgi:nanoRNase/pAp phosphatase (c-di-AMP/oligoRNAs hydrolase)
MTGGTQGVLTVGPAGSATPELEGVAGVGADVAAQLGGLDATTVAVAGVVAAVVVLAVLWRALRWFRRSKGVRFREALDRVDEVSVLMHPNPDPDAMSCAVAVAHLAEQEGVDASLQYPGRIQHQENRAFETVLDLEMERIETAADLDADDVVLVDHNQPRGFQGAEGLTPYAIVDHHPGGGSGAEFTDVRTDYGACASVVAEYFEDLDAAVVGPTADDYPDDLSLSPDVCTGLVYGIQSDTKNLTKGTSPAEFDACEYLYPGINEETLDRIANPQVEAEVLEVKARAIADREVEPPYAVADVGEVKNVDAIPQSADELARLEGISSVVVYGELDGTIHLSGRSRDDRVHMGNCLKEVADDIPMAGAGGHARMGGGQIQREHMEGLGPQQGMTKIQLKDRLFDAMRGEL